MKDNSHRGTGNLENSKTRKYVCYLINMICNLPQTKLEMYNYVRLKVKKS